MSVHGDGRRSQCLTAYGERHLFFKGNSAAVWHNEGPGAQLQPKAVRGWHMTQRDGFAQGCSDGGGSFYFAAFHSNLLSADMGVCAPSICTDEEVNYEVFPALYERLFYSDSNFGYAVQMHKGRPFEIKVAPQHALATLTFAGLLMATGCRRRWTLPAMKSEEMQAVVDHSLATALDAPQGGAAVGASGLQSQPRRSSWSVTYLIVVALMLAGELTLFSRWHNSCPRWELCGSHLLLLFCFAPWSPFDDNISRGRVPHELTL
eukprot:TRINITY_DN64575_c0_g1_i2.p1 TRINITY_DN64575_c0_g1~~TRINITY_DN64575_c0_g1_i2.p1  ORF type:complete len:262 (+),score=25.46 TRINITY_DN64575_c0_g1_i2:99-884(+)